MKQLNDIPCFKIEVNKDKNEEKTIVTNRNKGFTDNSYGKKALETAAKMIRESVNGEKHNTLLKASILLGGYVAGGFLSEDEAVETLKNAISQKEDVRSQKDAFKTIERGIQNGKQKPIKLENLERNRQDYLHVKNSTESKLGISYSQSEPSEKYESKPLSALPQDIYNSIPEYLKRCCNIFDLAAERDSMLIGSLGVLSGCMPNVFGIYDNSTVYSNLFTYIIASSSSGKSNLTRARSLGIAIHNYRREKGKIEEAAFKMAQYEYKASKKDSKTETTEEPPVNAPPLKLLFLPGNNSATGVIQNLTGNTEGGIIFCTEADTLSTTLGQDWGNFSDILRGAFHHEPYSFYRKTQKEYVELEDPRLSIVLSSTMGQVNTLIPDSENGLFSRFCFFQFKTKPTMKDVFKRSAVNFDDHFKTLSEQILSIYKHLEQLSHPIEFALTRQQDRKFLAVYTVWHDEFYNFFGEDSLPTIRRLGVITFRYCMILTVLRIIEHGDFSNPLICCDQDLETSLKIAEVLKEHALDLFIKLPKRQGNYQGFNQAQLSYYKALPQSFDRKLANKIAEGMGINLKTCETWLEKFRAKNLLGKPRHNYYEKPNQQDSLDSNDL